LHGTDIYNAVCDLLAARQFGPLEKLDVVFHKMTLRQLRGRIYLEEPAPEAECQVVFRCKAGGRPLTLILEEDGTPVTERVPYDEEALAAQATFDEAEKRIALEGCPSFSNIEKIVALNKALLLRSFPEAKGRWLFARLQLSQSIRPRVFEQIEVRFQGHSNFRITRSALFGDGAPLGSLYFSLLSQA
jgi:hypothetical protein